MNRMLDYAALALVIVGAVNWGLIGFFELDLVAWLFGDLTWISRIVYGLVGISGLYCLTFDSLCREGTVFRDTVLSGDYCTATFKFSLSNF